MRRSFAFLVLVSALVIACAGQASWGIFHSHTLPFTVDVVDAGTARVVPNVGIPLPAGVQAGDRLDLSALDADTRAAIAIQDLQGLLPADRTYPFTVVHDGARFSVPVTTISYEGREREAFTLWVFLGNNIMFAALALLILWRGRGRAAGLLATWLALVLVGFLFNYGYATDGAAGMVMESGALILYALARICLYLMFDVLVGPSLSPRTRSIMRGLFILVLLTGTTTILSGPLAFYFMGWAGLMRPVYGILFTAGYLVPALLLLMGYSRATEAQKPHLRWLLLATASTLGGVFFSNTAVFDISTTEIVQSVFMCGGISGFAYTVLFHRVVPVSMILDRTLVYGAITALVVGVVAALNSLALRVTLGEGTGLLLQIVVPLALGIVLGKVRSYLDRIVERVFFRTKYLAEKSLRNFARQCGHIDNIPKLLDAAVTEIARHTKSPGVAFYEITEEGYLCMRQKGEVLYPKRLDPNDPAVVAVRADLEPVVLADYASELGKDGCVFPMTVLGVLRGVMVSADRPGEHFASDEKALLSEVARAVGAAWRILRARDNEELVHALAKGTLKPTAALARAKALEAAWAGG